MKIDLRRLELELARRCMTTSDLRHGISPSTLAKIKRGGDVRPCVVGRIANILKIPVETLLGGDA